MSTRIESVSHDPQALVRALVGHFEARFGDSIDASIARAPGRVNLLGDHTDYNDGFVLPMTIDRAVWWVLRRRTDDRVRLHSINFDEGVEYRLGQRPAVSAGGWASYVTGVIEELRLLDRLESGFEGVVFGDVPLGGGLSSSAALEVATAVALEHLLGFPLEPVEAVKLCQKVEHVYAGVHCGIMDQFASRLGRLDHALYLDCRTLAHEDIPLPFDDVSVVIVNSGVKRTLAGSAYNERRAECDQAVAHFRRFDESVTALRDVTPELLARHGRDLPENVRNRARHVVEENGRVLSARALLATGQLAEFGRIMSESHASLRDLYEVSCAELDGLVEIAQGTDGVLGGRMTGAGFGGCAVFLSRKAAAPELATHVYERYPPLFNVQPTVFILKRNIEAGPVSIG